MARFGSSAHLAAWVGVAPRNDARAGKPCYGRTRHGDQALRTLLTQLAHTTARTKGNYLSALSHRLGTRRGRKEPIVASTGPHYWGQVTTQKLTALHVTVSTEPYKFYQ